MPRHSPAIWLALLLLLLALASVAADAYLASAGRPGMPDGTGAGLTAIVYDIRHLVTFPLPLLPGSAALVVTLVALARAYQLRRAPAQLLATVGVLAGGTVLLFLLPWVTQPVREAGFRRAAERMQPLVLAIERYEHANGHPPASLDPLAPEYLQDVERFGVRGCRELEYRTGGTPGRWELRLQCPNGWMSLDQFFYRPGERYLPHEHNQRFGGWAYFWD